MSVTGPGVIPCDVSVTGRRIRYFLVTWLLVQLTYDGGDAMGYRHRGCYQHGLGQPSTSIGQGAVTVQGCLGFCKSQPTSYPYIGLRRNGGSGAPIATCYCVASLSWTSTRCDWKCGANLPCGGSGSQNQYVNLYEDIDECLNNNGGCNQTCTNSPGSFLCSCEDGYSAIGASCMDIDECVTDNGGCDHVCTNSPGGYSCSCPEGYVSDNTTCTDIDECSSYNIGCEHFCINTLGSYHCICINGYQGNGTKCTDIDECATDNGGCDQECHNTAGSFVCRCRDGYQQEAGVCSDINECGDSPCAQSCHNVDGSFQCFCEPGWVIMEDNVTCAEPRRYPSPYSNAIPIWVYIVIGLLGVVVIAMAVVIFLQWRRHADTNGTQSASTPSRPLGPHLGSERAVPASTAAVSREDRPTDPEVSAAPADSQYEQIAMYTNSGAAQGVYEKVA